MNEEDRTGRIAELATLRLKEHGYIIEPHSESDNVVQYISKDTVRAVLWAEFQERYSIPGITTTLTSYRAKLASAKESVS